MEILEVVITSVIVSAIYNKIAAAHTFKVIDGYVRDVVELAKQLIRDTKCEHGSE